MPVPTKGRWRKPVRRFKVRWSNGLHKEAVLGKGVANNAAEVSLWGSKVCMGAIYNINLHI